MTHNARATTLDGVFCECKMGPPASHWLARCYKPINRLVGLIEFLFRVCLPSSFSPNVYALRVRHHLLGILILGCSFCSYISGHEPFYRLCIPLVSGSEASYSVGSTHSHSCPKELAKTESNRVLISGILRIAILLLSLVISLPIVTYGDYLVESSAGLTNKQPIESDLWIGMSILLSGFGIAGLILWIGIGSL